MTTFLVTRRMKMSADKVWNILSDFDHSPIPAFPVVVEEKGKNDLNGIGTTRLITMGKRQFREKLEALKPPNLIIYRLLSGAPVVNYIGNIDIKPIKNGTIINWKVQFQPKIIGTGWIVRWLAQKTINQILKEIEAIHQD